MSHGVKYKTSSSSNQNSHHNITSFDAANKNVISSKTPAATDFLDRHDRQVSKTDSNGSDFHRVTSGGGETESNVPCAPVHVSEGGRAGKKKEDTRPRKDESVKFRRSGLFSNVEDKGKLWPGVSIFFEKLLPSSKFLDPGQSKQEVQHTKENQANLSQGSDTASPFVQSAYHQGKTNDSPSECSSLSWYRNRALTGTESRDASTKGTNTKTSLLDRIVSFGRQFGFGDSSFEGEGHGSGSQVVKDKNDNPENDLYKDSRSYPVCCPVVREHYQREGSHFQDPQVARICSGNPDNRVDPGTGEAEQSRSQGDNPDKFCLFEMDTTNGRKEEKKGKFAEHFIDQLRTLLCNRLSITHLSI